VHPLLRRLKPEDEWACVQVITIDEGYGDFLERKSRFIEFPQETLRDADYYVFIGKFSIMDLYASTPDALGSYRGPLPDHMISGASMKEHEFCGSGVRARTHWAIGWIAKQRLGEVCQHIAGGPRGDKTRVSTAQLNTTSYLPAVVKNAYWGRRAHMSYTGYANPLLASGQVTMPELEAHVRGYLTLVEWWFDHQRVRPGEFHVAAFPRELLPLLMLSTATSVQTDFYGWFFLRLTIDNMRESMRRQLWLGEYCSHRQRYFPGVLERFAVWLMRTRLQTCLRHLQEPMLEALYPDGTVPGLVLRVEMQRAWKRESKRARLPRSAWFYFKKAMYPDDMETAEYKRDQQLQKQKKESKQAMRESDDDEDEEEDEKKGDKKKQEGGGGKEPDDLDDLFMPPAEDVFKRVPFEMRLDRTVRRRTAGGARRVYVMWQGDMIERCNENIAFDLTLVARTVVHPQMIKLLQQPIADRSIRWAMESKQERFQRQWICKPFVAALADMEHRGQLALDALTGQLVETNNMPRTSWAVMRAAMPGCLRRLSSRHIPHDFRWGYYTYARNCGVDPNELLRRIRPHMVAEWEKTKSPTEVREEWTAVTKDVQRIYRKGLSLKPEAMMRCSQLAAPDVNLCPYDQRAGLTEAQKKCVACTAHPNLRFSSPVERALALRGQMPRTYHPVFYAKK
jgi:hypothetical protein